MNGVVVQCPAKINLFLSVGPPDATGYHPIRTVFQAVSLFDEVRIERSDRDTFVCDWPSIPADNTVVKAWRLAKEYVSLPAMEVRLTKQIPAESGLGGGSSDAAGFLRGLIRLTRDRFTSENAVEVAAAVGADVPFFLVGGRAQGEGYGGRLTPLPDGMRRDLVVARPERGVSTKDAYRALDDHVRPWRDFPEEPWALYNDFEAVAPKECRELACTLKETGADQTLLCGSGSAVFGTYPNGETAKEACRRLAARGAAAWNCHTLGRTESLWTS